MQPDFDLHIAVCDDNIQDCQTLTSLLRTFCSSRHLQADIQCFSQGEDFIASCQKNSYDIVYMDIYLPGINGMEAVARTRLTVSFQIVFVTVSREHAVDAFSLNAAHYLLKPLTQTDVSASMERCLSRINTNFPKCLEIKTSLGKIPIPFNSIVYIEVFNKICVIHTEKSTFQTYTSLDTIYKSLDSNIFLRVQRSFIVNMRFIKTFVTDHIVLLDGKSISLSRHMRAKLKKQYQDFLFYLLRRGEI